MARKHYILPSDEALQTIRERLRYDPETGTLRWLIAVPRRGIAPGDEAGCARAPPDRPCMASGPGCRPRLHQRACRVVPPHWRLAYR